MKKSNISVGLALLVSSIVLSLVFPVNQTTSTTGQITPTLVADGPGLPPPPPPSKFHKAAPAQDTGAVLVA